MNQRSESANLGGFFGVLCTQCEPWQGQRCMADGRSSQGRVWRAREHARRRRKGPSELFSRNAAVEPQTQKQSGSEARRRGSTRGTAEPGEAGRIGLLRRTRAKMVKETRLYDLIGVSPGASDAEMKKSYRKKAMKYHPDRNPEAGNKVNPGAPSLSFCRRPGLSVAVPIGACSRRGVFCRRFAPPTHRTVLLDALGPRPSALSRSLVRQQSFSLLTTARVHAAAARVVPGNHNGLRHALRPREA